MRSANLARFSAIAFSALVSFALSLPVGADELQPFEQRELYEFEQCADLCQRQLDDSLFLCMPYRKDAEKEVAEDCGKISSDTYDRCMNACPVDPRQRR